MIVFSNKCGQLGNRLFAFAHLIAIAEANNLKVINLSFDEYAKYFQTTSKDIFCRYPHIESFGKSDSVRSWLFVFNKVILRILRLIKLHNSFIHKIIIADLPEYQFNLPLYYELNSSAFLSEARKKKIVFLFGRFFRDYKHLEEFQNIVRAYFRPVDEIRIDVERIFELARENSEIVVGVHIRRGDYRSFVDGKYFYSIEQYKEKMKQLQDSMAPRKVIFMVCSNEVVGQESFQPLKVVTGPGHLVKDLYLLTKCDYIMGPPSTYTLWASFYGNKPLYQLKDLSEPARLACFKTHPPEILYNFSFN